MRLINTYYYLKTIDMPGNYFILPGSCKNRATRFNAKTVYSRFCPKKCSEAATHKKKTHEKQETLRSFPHSQACATVIFKNCVGKKFRKRAAPVASTSPDKKQKASNICQSANRLINFAANPASRTNLSLKIYPIRRGFPDPLIVG